MDELIFGKIEEHWLDWVSLPFAFVISVLSYFAIVLNLDEWLGIELMIEGYLMLAAPFLLLFLGYLTWCIIHQHHIKKNPPAEEELPDEEKEKIQKKNKARNIWIVSGACALTLVLVAAIAVGLATDKTLHDGKYVIWVERYHMSLTPEVVNDYYLKGDEVLSEGTKLKHYTARSVVELDFEKDGTFTITHNGQKLGVVPNKKTGVGYGDKFTNCIWELVPVEEAEEGAYYIRNTQENTYLTWLVDKTDWTTHDYMSEKKIGQYIMRLKRVK